MPRASLHCSPPHSAIRHSAARLSSRLLSSVTILPQNVARFSAAHEHWQPSPQTVAHGAHASSTSTHNPPTHPMQPTRYLQSTDATSKVLTRTINANGALLQISDGTSIRGRRYIPIGRGDTVLHDNGNLYVLAAKDSQWIEVGRPWTYTCNWIVAGKPHTIIFKEIETDLELTLFNNLREFHYRGGGGAGRTVPLIAVATTWDLPRLLGFIELSSSMIANTARKTFFDFPYRESNGHGWVAWDRAATKQYSNVVARISRFVIHPELRGLGLARHFLHAVIEYATSRWHYGGFRPRFLEITADMLRYYKFVGPEFIYLGDTEGNEHRITGDMNYLVKKALSPEGAKAMPQGGGGIMTMQRGYATRLIDYMRTHSRSLGDVVNLLRYDPSRLDQNTWEALYRLNRRPKPCYAAALTPTSKAWLAKRAEMVQPAVSRQRTRKAERPTAFSFTDVAISARAEVAQSNDARRLQDAFGFVGAQLGGEIIAPTSFELVPGTITMICGASGAGKSLFGHAIRTLCADCPGALLSGDAARPAPVSDVNLLGELPCPTTEVEIEGRVDPQPTLAQPRSLKERQSVLEQLPNVPLERLMAISARCGLAEPQLFVRPVASLSSGQRYRMQVARELLHQPDLLYIDNFCEPLDRFTAAAVCRGLERIAGDTGLAIVVCTAAYDRLLPIMRPAQIILLRRGNQPVVTKDIDGAIRGI